MHLKAAQREVLNLLQKEMGRTAPRKAKRFCGFLPTQRWWPLGPLVRQLASDRDFPRSALPEMSALGLELGVLLLRIAMEISRASLSTAMSFL